MVSRSEMMEPMLRACPSYQKEWDEFLSKWKDDPDPPQYIAIAGLVRHVIRCYEAGDQATVERVFAVVERWHLEGDPYVKEAATVGFLEDLQNGNFHARTSPKDFEKFLGPESRRWWSKVTEFWEQGKPIADP